MMRTEALRGAMVLVAAAMCSATCDERVSSIAGPSPSLAPTFSSIVTEIFSSSDLAGRAACVNCHTNVGRTPAAGLTLLPDVAYAQLLNVPSVTNPGHVRVVPGDPDNSILIGKLEGRPGMRGARMPFNTPPYLTEGQILIIRRWIERGAPND